MNSTEITPQRINQWKKEHGQVYKLIPDPSRPGLFCIVRHPKIEDIVLSSTIGGSDKIKTGKSQLETCWLGGDESIKTDAELNRSAALQMGKIFEVLPSGIDYIENVETLKFEWPTDAHERAKQDGSIRRIWVQSSPKVVLEAFLFKPSLEDLEKADTASNIVERGTIFLQECWICGDEELKTGSDEVRFTAYLQALNLFRHFTADLVKL